MFLPWATGCQPSSLPTPPPGVPPALEPSGLLGTLWLTKAAGTLASRVPAEWRVD